MARNVRRFAIGYVLTAAYPVGVLLVLVNRKDKTATALTTVDYSDPDLPMNNERVSW